MPHTPIKGSGNQSMQCLWVGAPDSSTVEVAASPPAVHLWPELSLKLHQAPDPGAVGAEVGSRLAASSRMVARSTPSSSAHRSSGGS